MSLMKDPKVSVLVRALDLPIDSAAQNWAFTA
jgi:hypothetical protein